MINKKGRIQDTRRSQQTGQGHIFRISCIIISVVLLIMFFMPFTISERRAIGISDVSSRNGWNVALDIGMVFMLLPLPIIMFALPFVDRVRDEILAVVIAALSLLGVCLLMVFRGRMNDLYDVWPAPHINPAVGYYASLVLYILLGVVAIGFLLITTNNSNRRGRKR